MTRQTTIAGWAGLLCWLAGIPIVTETTAFAQANVSAGPIRRVAEPLSPEDQARRIEEQQKRILECLHEQVEPTLPDKPAAQPKQTRRLLVFTLSKGASHGSATILGARTFKLMGKKTGAFEATISNDPQVFAPERLRQFDAVMMVNTTGTLFGDETLKKPLLDFFNGGKGICGIHAATDCFHQWRDYLEMTGGEFDGHPLKDITVKNEDPTSPINAAFEGRSFAIKMETYVFRTPYSREKLHVLLSVDWEIGYQEECRFLGQHSRAANGLIHGQELDAWLEWFNEFRPHSRLAGKTPNEVRYKRKPANELPRIEPRAR